MLEDIVKQIRAMLQNQLPTKFDQIELERADGVGQEDIQSFFIQERPREARLKYPNITIYGVRTTATNALCQRREMRHEISLWIMDRVVAPDSDLSQTRLLRYVEGVERILAFDPTLGGKAVDSVITNHIYLPKGTKGDEFVRMAMLDMEVLERPSAARY